MATSKKKKIVQPVKTVSKKPVRMSSDKAARKVTPLARQPKAPLALKPHPGQPVKPQDKPPIKIKQAVQAQPVKAAEPKRPNIAPTVKFSEKEMLIFRRELLALRERLTSQVDKMRQAALRRDDEVNQEEDGSDAFDRFFTLERAGSDQEIIFCINESLQAIDAKTYGTCERCGGLIEKPRLQALPFAKNCVACQSEMERNRNGGGTRRHPLP